MCMDPSPVVGLSRYNWDGQDVVFNPIVPSSRPVVGGKRSYAIDVREFLVTERNAVIRAEIEERIRPHLSATPGAWERFTSREKGGFDYRAAVVFDWVSSRVKYAKKGSRDPWQFPDETLALRSGDCEDRAFLIASLFLASGISGYHVRVALGEVRTMSGKRFDHAWVMYKSEAGRWLLVEPLLTASSSVKRSTSRRKRGRAPVRANFSRHGAIEYVPKYLFNADHLWSTGGEASSFERVVAKAWRKMDPKFAGEVHRTILHRALADVVPSGLMAALDARFSPAVLRLFGPTVDESDRGAYEPTDHFDNGLIDESWAVVRRRMDRFRADGTDYASFAGAAHAVADFYAHSSYGHFAKVNSSSAEEPCAEPFDPSRADELLREAPVYSARDGEPRFDLTSDRFTLNTRLWKKSKQAAADEWRGSLLSGRYGQAGDSRGDFVQRWFVEGPAKLPDEYAKPSLGSLPHHIEIAVDGPEPDAHHRLYGERDYAYQYRLRVNTAVAHVRQLFLESKPRQ